MADDLYIGSGKVISLYVSNKKVHKIEMEEDEALEKRIQHPIYNYDLEVGSFTAWKLEDVVVGRGRMAEQSSLG